MLRRFLWQPEVAFFLLAFLAVSARFRDRAFNDPGSLWHIKVGERILNDGFMITDPFTFTFVDRTWIPQQWGGEVLLAAAHSLGGFDAVLLGFSSGVAALFTWLFSRLVRDGMHPLLAGVVAGGAGVVAAFHFYARPHMATLAGLAITMGVVVDYARGRAGPWHLFALIPFFAVWTNIHGGVLGGVLTLGMAVGMWIGFPVEKGTRRKLFLLAVLAACVLTPFMNPFGLEMLRTWQRIVGSPAMAELVSEHQPLSIYHTAGQVVLGFAAFYALVLFGVHPRQWKLIWLLPVVWFVLTLKGIRQGPLFAVVAAVVVADVWPRSKWYEWIKKHGDTLATEPSENPRSWRWLALPVLLLLLGTTMMNRGLTAAFVGRDWAELNPVAWPVELIEPLQNYAASVPPNTRIFNDANLGGFVLYHTPSLKIFMDDRFELYGDAWIREYAEVVYKHPERFDEWTKQYGFEVAILFVEPVRTALELYLSESPQWEELTRCDRGVMFRRRGLSKE